MAAITIRNLTDDVVLALKQRARRHGRSMEAEARAVLGQLAAGDAGGGAEHVLASHAGQLRSVAWADVSRRMHINPPPPIDAAWADELHAERDDDPLTDPWAPRAAS